MNRYHGDIGAHLDSIIGETIIFINDNDLNLASYALELAKNVTTNGGKLGNSQKVVDTSVALAESQLLQGQATTKLLEFFSAVHAKGVYPVDQLVTKLFANITLKS